MATNPNQFRFKASEVFADGLLANVDEDVSLGLKKNKSEPVLSSGHNRKARLSLISSGGSRFGFWKQSADLVSKMSKPLVIASKYVFWHGFIFLRTSDNVYERRFTLVCEDRMLMMNRLPIYHLDEMYNNASRFIIPTGYIQTEISILRIRRVFKPLASSTMYVCGMPHTLELHCDALPKVLLFPSSDELDEFQSMLSDLMKLHSNYYPNNVNKITEVSLQDDIVPASSVLWRGWVSIMRKETNVNEESEEEQEDEKRAPTTKVRRYVLLLDSQRFVVSTAPPLLFASDNEINTIHSTSSQPMESSKNVLWGVGGYFKIPSGTEEEDISLMKTNTVVCFDQVKESFKEKVEAPVSSTSSDGSSSSVAPVAPSSPSSRQARKTIIVDLSMPLGLKLTDQCLISGIDKGRQCEKLDVKVGQCITAVNGEPVKSKQHLIERFSAAMQTNQYKTTKLEVFESYLEKGFSSIYEFDAVMGAVGGGVVEASEALRESLASEEPVKEVKKILIDPSNEKRKSKKNVKILEQSKGTKSEGVHEKGEDSESDDKVLCIRIISKLASSAKKQGTKPDDVEDSCLVVDILCEKASSPELAAKEASNELQSNMPTSLFKQDEKFLSTAEMMRTGGFGNRSTKLPSAQVLRNAVISLRKNGGCSWRKVPTLSGDFLLISAATGRAGLWQSATLREEFLAAKSAVEEASLKLASLPIVTYPVIHLATRGRQLPRFLTLNATCIQRTSVAFAQRDHNTSLQEAGLLKGFTDRDTSGNTLGTDDEKAIHAGEYNFFDKALNIVVNRTILFSDLINIASFLAPMPAATPRASASLTARVGRRGSFGAPPASTPPVSVSTNHGNRRSLMGLGSSAPRKTFLFKIQEDNHVSDVDELNDLSVHEITVDTTPSTSMVRLYHQRARGRLRIEASVSDGKLATWYSGRARRGSTEINEAFTSSTGKRGSSFESFTSGDSKQKKKRNERSFIYETGYASKLEEQIQIRWKLFEMQANMADTNHTTARYSSRNTSKYITGSKSKAVALLVGDTMFELEMRKKHSEMVDFLYGPAINIQHQNTSGESGITAPVLGAIEAFVDRVGASNILAECAYFIEDFVQYLMERFFSIMMESSESSFPDSELSGSNHGGSDRGSNLSDASEDRRPSSNGQQGNKVRDQAMVEAEQALRLQLHKLVVDTLVVPVLGERLWLSALDQNAEEDEAFSRGILMLMMEEEDQVKQTKNQEETKDVMRDENDVIRKLDEERIIDWEAAAKELGALEHTMNPSDQLDVIKSAVDIITNSPVRPPPNSAQVDEDMVPEPMSADELIPAFIKVVSRAASRAAQRSAVGIDANVFVSAGNIAMPPLATPLSQNSTVNRAMSFRSLESGGLLSPSSTVCYMRALIPNDLLVSEPGFILALLEGAVAFISSISNPTSEEAEYAEGPASVSSIASSSRRSSSRRSSMRPSFRPSEAIRERLERGLSTSYNMQAQGSEEVSTESASEELVDLEKDQETVSSSSLWGAKSTMIVSDRRSRSSKSTVSLSSNSFDVWRSSALQDAYAEVDSGSSDEEARMI